MRSVRNRRLALESLEGRALLACTGVGTTQVVCFSSVGPGAAESSWLPPAAPGHAIEGYTSEASVAPGETLELRVSADTAANYKVEVYRLGWYGGLGGRLVACLPNCTGGSVAATNQGIPSPDPVTREVRANWGVNHAFIVPTDWASGYYLANLVLTTGPNAGLAHRIPFIVRAPSARNADILVQVPVNTWQAYNRWGGHSLYDPLPADKVSFDRPYDGLSGILRYEYELVRYLEREGFDVEYATNVDVHRQPSMLLNHNVVVSSGHDEYWTGEMRTAFEAARDAGTDLVFMGSNSAYWQIRFENGEQTVVGYKVTPATVNEDPEPSLAKKSMTFRDLTPARPECQLLGVQFMQTFTTDFNTDESTYKDLTVNSAALTDPWFANTGIVAGSVFAKRVGYEWDQIVPGCKSGLTTYFQYSAGAQSSHATKYVAPSGATVFATGTMGFNYALDNWRPSGTAVSPADPRLQTFLRNVLIDLAESPSTQISIRAAGYTGTEQMQLQINGVPVQTWSNVGGSVATRTFQTFNYTHAAPVTVDQIRVAFINDGNTPTGADRNLAVDAITINGTRFETEGVATYSTGTYSSATGCAPGFKSNEDMHCNGYFQFAQPGATTTIHILAAGYTQTEQMKLLVNGVAVRTWNNVGGNFSRRQFQPYVYTHPANLGLSQIRVAFTNDGNTVTGADKNLGVDQVVVNGARFETEAPTTYSTGSYSSGTGCSPGNKMDESLHCNGYFQYSGSLPVPAPTTTSQTSSSRVGVARGAAQRLHAASVDRVLGSLAVTVDGRLPEEGRTPWASRKTVANVRAQDFIASSRNREQQK